MKGEEFFSMLEQVDPELLQRAEAVPEKRKTQKWHYAVAAVLVLACLMAGGWMQSRRPGQTGMLLDPEAPPEKLSGNALSFVIGDSLEAPYGMGAEPPEFQFESTGIVVEAKAIACLPGEYTKLDGKQTEKRPTVYRIFQMETVQTVHGRDVPERFWYLLPAYLYTDLTTFDSLLISMDQIGAENYVLRNSTENKMEALPQPVFAELYDNPHLGNMIAFTDGVFDESLWQTESWHYGYQFGKYYLDYDDGDLVVRRGNTSEQVIQAIKADIREAKQWLADRYREPAVISLKAVGAAAQKTLAFVAPFENGVFVQQLDTDYYGNTKICYRRYINGCETDEELIVELSTGVATHTETRYIQAELAVLPDIGRQIDALTEQYKENPPIPLNVNPEGKELVGLNLYGWYAMTDSGPVGIVRTQWMYLEEEKNMCYLDASYMLYDGKTEEPRILSQQEATALVGTRNVYQGEYGQGIWISNY